jgi:hypothetical protein
MQTPLWGAAHITRYNFRTSRPESLNRHHLGRRPSSAAIDAEAEADIASDFDPASILRRLPSINQSVSFP